MSNKTLKRSLIRFALAAILLLVIALAALNMGDSFSFWHHQSGQTLTETVFLPRHSWGYGQVSGIISRHDTFLLNGVVTTKYGCFAVIRYDLRIWNYDPNTGMVSCMGASISG